MLEGIFGKDNDMLIWIIIIFLLLSDGFGGKNEWGGHGGNKGGLFGDNIIIWIIIIFLFLGDNKEHDHGHH